MFILRTPFLYHPKKTILENPVQTLIFNERTLASCIMPAHSGKRKVNKRLKRKILIDDIQFYIRLNFEHSKLTNDHHMLQQIENNDAKLISNIIIT